MERIPVLLITGFLGSGKTSFLNHLIQDLAPERIFVVENEVGQVNIDSELVLHDKEDIAGLTAGCLCCSLHDKLLDVLEEVSYRREELDRLVIETTGVADPSTIIRTFLANPMVERVFELQQVVCVADAPHIMENLSETDEARRQLVSADVVLINKCDLVSSDSLLSTVKTLKGIHPSATFLRGSHGRFPIQEILETPLFHDEISSLGETVSETGEHQHSDITTHTLTFDRPFELDSLTRELIKLTRLHRHQIYRIKGILHVRHIPTRVVVQSVRDNFVLSDGPPWSQDDSARQSHIVIIGRDLQKVALVRLFGRHLAR